MVAGAADRGDPPGRSTDPVCGKLGYWFFYLYLILGHAEEIPACYQDNGKYHYRIHLFMSSYTGARADLQAVREVSARTLQL